jgi:hypothetical protein
MIAGACAEIKMFVVSEGLPLVVAEFFDTLSTQHGYLHCKPSRGPPRAVEWAAGLKVVHCTVVERAGGTVDFVPVDRITAALIPAGFIAEALANHRGRTYPKGPAKRKKAATSAKKSRKKGTVPTGTGD